MLGNREHTHNEINLYHGGTSPTKFVGQSLSLHEIFCELFNVIFWKKYDLSHNVTSLQDKNTQRLPKLDSDQNLPKNTTRSLSTSFPSASEDLFFSTVLFFYKG